MQQWGYAVVLTQGGVTQTPNGPMNVPQMLNFVGQRGGELVTAILAGPGQLEWIFKFAAEAPQNMFQ
jgi:hypothetical protein